jgi:ketosteroid isomerase-like protein
MKRVSALWAAIALICVFESGAFAQVEPAHRKSAERRGNSEIVQQVLAVDEARRVAMLHGDIKALDGVIADDATIVWGDGTVDDKTSTLALFRSGRLRYEQLDYHNTRVRIYGDTALVTGNGRVQAQADRRALQHLVLVTRVYVRQQGRWRLVASQTTRVGPTANRAETSP